MTAPTIIATANRKGGVGKTTTVINLAAALASQGAPTLMIDMDPQANLTVHAGLNPLNLNEHEQTIHGALRPRPEDTTELLWAGILHRLGRDLPLWLAPAGRRLDDAEIQLTADAGGPFALAQALARLPAYLAAPRFILLDCPPSIGRLTVAALYAADLLLVPTQTEALSIYGVATVLQERERLQRHFGRAPQVLGLLPTMHSRRLQGQQGNLQALAEHFSGQQIFPIIPRAAAYASCAERGEIPLLQRPRTPGLQVFRSMAAMLIARQEATDAA